MILKYNDGIISLLIWTPPDIIYNRKQKHIQVMLQLLRCKVSPNKEQIRGGLLLLKESTLWSNVWLLWAFYTQKAWL